MCMLAMNTVTFWGSYERRSSVEEHVCTLLALKHFLNGLLQRWTNMSVIELKPTVARRGQGRGTGGREV